MKNWSDSSTCVWSLAFFLLLEDLEPPDRTGFPPKEFEGLVTEDVGRGGRGKFRIATLVLGLLGRVRFPFPLKVVVDSEPGGVAGPGVSASASPVEAVFFFFLAAFLAAFFLAVLHIREQSGLSSAEVVASFSAPDMRGSARLELLSPLAMLIYSSIFG